jgi:DNA-3-methyladenine glycosylase
MAGCILIRALEPLLGLGTMAHNRRLSPDSVPTRLTGGPGILCQALEINRQSHNGLDLLDRASPLQLRDDGFVTPSPGITPRIGIRHAAELPLRFHISNHPCVSRVPKSKFLIASATS